MFRPSSLTKVGKASSVFTWLLASLLLFVSVHARAVPSFARQTGENCIACHVSFPELTPLGRMFKLTGYTLQNKSTIPLSVMLQVSQTNVRDKTGSGPDTFDFQRDGGVALQAASLFYAGKIADHVGAFAQWTYDGLAHHSSLDNTDIRYADRITTKDVDWVYGFTLHNNPTAQDVWNTTPAFGYPYASPPITVSTASTMLDGGLGQQVAGLGGYAFWNKSLYGELSFYRTADQIFSVFRAGQDTATSGGVKALKGYNPYWRFAYNHEWGPNSFMVGTYGMVAEQYPDNLDPTGPTDRLKDIALDAQYQYITDPHTFTAQVNWIHEKQDWNASGPAGLGATSNPSDTLKTFKAKASYYYQRKYGATLAYFSTTGDVDAALYPDSGTVITGNINNSPDNRGYIMELDYLPVQNIKLSLQYTAYQKFNGASSNYDGNGRSASDNNTLYLLGWFMF